MFRNLEAELTRKNITRKDLARILGINVSTCSEKLTKPGRLKLDEAFKIRDTLFPEMQIEYLFSKIETPA